jgi:hypothetical protein
MCTAITIGPNKTLQQEHALNCFNRNDDGCGFAYIENGKVLIKKGYFDFNNFWEDFDAIQQINKLPKLVHFRIATSGLIDLENCHPWEIDSEHALIHNGIIPAFYAAGGVSDTGLFVEKLIKPIFKHNSEQYKDPCIKLLLEDYIGKNNKIAFLDKDGNIDILNEKEGIWEDGIWFSNLAYLTPAKKEVKKETPKKCVYTPSTGTYPSSICCHGRKFRHNNVKKVKGRSKYYLATTGEALSQREINNLTSRYHKKIKQLVNMGIVTRGKSSAETGRPDKAEYESWWEENLGNRMFQ